MSSFLAAGFATSLLLLAACAAAAGCALGDEPGGCRSDAECPERFS